MKGPVVQGIGKVAEQTGMRGFSAIVHITCDPSDGLFCSLMLHPTTDLAWLQSEGFVEASLVGATLGLRIANRTAKCMITNIQGKPCDTNSTLVAIAAMLAVWNALNFVPDPRTIERLQDSILRSTQIPVEDLGNELAFTDQ